MLDERPGVGMVITDVAHIDRAGKPMGIVGAGCNPSEDFARLFVQGYVPTPSAAMIRKKVLDAVGGFDEAFGSAGMDDHDLWPRIAAACTIANIEEPPDLSSEPRSEIRAYCVGTSSPAHRAAAQAVRRPARTTAVSSPGTGLLLLRCRQASDRGRAGS
ncbi:MAG: hypothetical protein EPO61_08555 [Nitrospirae bacterium]|nr:MAG: hypothetical protein EPO61_08555 [Nitrospirota bacterium]